MTYSSGKQIRISKIQPIKYKGLDALRQEDANPYDDPRRSNRSQNNYNSGNNQQYIPIELDTTKSDSSKTCYGMQQTGTLQEELQKPTSLET